MTILLNEQWLYDNPEALASVLRGIEDAKAGRFVDFDLSKDLELCESIEEDE